MPAFQKGDRVKILESNDVSHEHWGKEGVIVSELIQAHPGTAQGTHPQTIEGWERRYEVQLHGMVESIYFSESHLARA